MQRIRWALPSLCVAGAAGLLGLLTATHFSSLAIAQQGEPQTITIPDGTLIPLYLMDNLNSKTNKSDDPVRFKVREDVRINGKVVIPWNSPGVGKVVIVGGRGMAGRAGSVNFTVEYVKAADGSNVRVRGAPTIKGGGNTSVAAASAVAFGPGALLFMRGAHAEIRKGTMLSVYSDGDRQVAVKTTAPVVPGAAAGGLAGTQPAAPAAGPSQPPAKGGVAAVQPAAGQSQPEEDTSEADEELSTVIVKSTPPGGEVTLNGRFMGSTPSTLQLKPGDHTIVIEKEGFIVWKRTLTVRPGGIVNVDARLESAQ
ncbi:MAG: PEGA domain-containing protein [Terriglobia bacterium]